MDECISPVMDTGLRGVDVASSKICDVRGKEGKLICFPKNRSWKILIKA